MNNPAPQPQDTPNQPLDLDALAALLEAATPGPWEVDDEGLPHADLWSQEADGQVHLIAIRQRPEDAALIAALRNAAPDLIAAATGSGQGFVVSGGQKAANVALSVWSNTCNAYCCEEDQIHAPECILASDLYGRINTLNHAAADCHPWKHVHDPSTDEPVSVPCPTCAWPNRETTGLVCQTCGWDYVNGEKP